MRLRAQFVGWTRRVCYRLFLVCVLGVLIGNWSAPSPAGAITPGCTQWTTHAVRLLSGGSSRLLDAVATDLDTIWAVGSTNVLGFRDAQPLIQRWDGAMWLTMPTPTFADNLLYGGGVLRAVDASGPNDVWAVGYLGPSEFEVSAEEPLIMHWDGSQWSRRPNTEVLAAMNSLADLVVLAPNNVWALGKANGAGFLAHWNGTAWRTIPAPPIGGETADLRSFAVRSANDIWVVGAVGIGVVQPVVLRYNGSAWSQILIEGTGGLLNGVAVHEDQVWAVGEAVTADSPVALYWDGARMRRAAFAPDPDRMFPELQAVAITADGRAWTAGFTGTGGAVFVWNGDRWESAEYTGYDDRLYALLPQPDGRIWTFGTRLTPEPGETSRGSTLVRSHQQAMYIADAQLVPSEDETDPATLEIRLALSSPAAGTVRVTARTADAGAVAGRDYQALETQVSFPPCTTSATVRVPLLTAAEPRAGAALRLALSEPVGASLPTPAARTIPLRGLSTVALPTLSTAPAYSGRIAYIHVSGDSFSGFNWDIYTKRPDGSERRQLTTSPALDSEPAWSPDGARIAFVSNRDGNPEIYVMNADGSAQTRLTFDPSADYSPAWSPDGARIAFMTEREGTRLLYVMNADGSNMQRISPPGAAMDDQPSWSPDGQWIAFSSQRNREYGIYIMRPDGSDLRRVTDGYNDAAPAWSPDGRFLAFSGERGLHIGVFIFDFATGALREMNPNFNGGQLPAWSPDGRAIITGATTSTTLRIVPLDGTQAIFVPGRPEGEFAPDWTPYDGR